MLTAAVRDLHSAHPREFQTDVRTSANDLWLHNPHLTQLQEGAADVRQLDMHYPLVHQSNERPYHFLHGYVQYLEQQLGLRIPVTRFQGDVHLSPEEKRLPVPGAELGVPEHFWIIMAGGKYDFTAKWWNPESYQAVVDHFQGRIQFVQCGEQGHWHPKLTGVIDLIGKTSLREFIRLMHHADGVVCPVTFAMHLAAAVETRPGRPRNRPCVVVAGGREPAHWEAYPGHQFLSTNSALSCCATGGCWKSRCQPVGDKDPKDLQDLCSQPVQISEELRIPKCLDLITPADVMRRIELCYAGGALAHAQESERPSPSFRKQSLQRLRPLPFRIPLRSVRK
jgi:ADP-heptose:LPS heptosyltransferase